ncbi:MAG: radical SAM family heme chaperone HemW [Caldilineaceae bacterium]|nr:radical SAM family heme chaperone HemW [Caldilineaceae bacterium]
MNVLAGLRPTYSERRAQEEKAPVPEAGEGPLGLYIHIPFCARKCPYCDFNTYARLEPLYEACTQALCREMGRWAARLDGRTVDTVFLGGGTPTVLSSGQLRRILEQVHDRFELAVDVEISSEANPGIEDRGQFALLRSSGVNRLSMGVQSFQAEELDFLGRIHDAEDALRAYDAATEAGFDNINLDFMFGLSRQPVEAWNNSLDKALDLAPRHLSLYSLIVEPDTPLAHWVETGRTPAPDDDLAAEMYEIAMSRLREAGYEQYEVSNWARGAGFACRHNLLYWRNQEWVGIGPGAHSHLRFPTKLRGESTGGLSFLFDDACDRVTGSGAPAAAVRWSNVKGVQGYVRRVEADESPVSFHEELPAEVSMGETMMLGLRLVREGVPFARFEAMHGQPMRAAFGPSLDRLHDGGLLESDGERVRLTPKGLLVGNRVFSEFVA